LIGGDEIQKEDGSKLVNILANISSNDQGLTFPNSQNV
jgi:hypothetical protein